jgi:hypothetical protein
VAISGKVTYFPTVKAWSFRVWLLMIGLSLDVHGIVIFWLGRICVGIVALVLASVVWGSGPRQVHWYLDVVIRGLQCVGRVILWPLLLLLLLGSSSPGSWSELILVLSECVVESSQIGNSLSGSDELNHLSSFGYVDCSGLVFIVILRDWEFDDFV